MKKIKYWLWFYFGKRNYVTIWSSPCNANIGNPLFGNYTKISATAIVKWDKERGKYQSYITDGVRTNDIELAIFVSENSELKAIL